MYLSCNPPFRFLSIREASSLVNGLFLKIFSVAPNSAISHYLLGIKSARSINTYTKGVA